MRIGGSFGTGVRVLAGIICRHSWLSLMIVTVLGAVLVPIAVAPIRMGPFQAELDRNLGLGVLLLAGTFQAFLFSIGGLARAREAGTLQMILVQPMARWKLYTGWLAAQGLAVLATHLGVLLAIGFFLGSRDGGVSLLPGTGLLGMLLVLRVWILVSVGSLLGALGFRPVAVAGWLALFLLAGHLTPLVAEMNVLRWLIRLVPDLSLFVPEGPDQVDFTGSIAATGFYLFGYGLLGLIAFRRLRA